MATRYANTPYDGLSSDRVFLWPDFQPDDTYFLSQRSWIESQALSHLFTERIEKRFSSSSLTKNQNWIRSENVCIFVFTFTTPLWTEQGSTDYPVLSWLPDRVIETVNLRESVDPKGREGSEMWNWLTQRNELKFL